MSKTTFVYDVRVVIDECSELDPEKFSPFWLTLLPLDEETTYKRAQRMINLGWDPDKILEECTIFSVPQHKNNVRIPILHLVKHNHPLANSWSDVTIRSALYNATLIKLAEERASLFRQKVDPEARDDWGEMFPIERRIAYLERFAELLTEEVASSSN